jgi:hypothetical protein
VDKLVAARVDPSQKKKDRAAVAAEDQNAFGGIAKSHLAKLEGAAEVAMAKNLFDFIGQR